MAPQLYRAFLSFWGFRRKESSHALEVQSAVSTIIRVRGRPEAGSRGQHVDSTPFHNHKFQSNWKSSIEIYHAAVINNNNLLL